MKIRNICLSIVLVIVTGISLNAQSFVTPLKSITGDATVITVDGKTLHGKVRSSIMGTRGISRLGFTENNGTKHSFKAVDIKHLKIKVDGLARLELIDDKTSNLKKLINADFDEIVDRQYIYYDKVVLPNKSDSYRLLQLVNPGFDQKIKVYYNPIGQSGTTTIGDVVVSGNEARSYIVLKQGKPGSEVIKKAKYKKKHFSSLFGDCPKLQSMYPSKEIRFYDFAEHVVIYNSLCK